MMRRLSFTAESAALFPLLWVGFTLGGNALSRAQKGGALREIVTAEAGILRSLKAVSHERERTEAELLQIEEIATARGVSCETADAMIPKERVLTTIPCTIDLTQAEHERIEKYLDAYQGWLTTGAEQLAAFFDFIGAATRIAGDRPGGLAGMD